MLCKYCGKPTMYFWAYYPGAIIGPSYPITVEYIQEVLSSLDWVEQQIQSHQLIAACEKCIAEYYNSGAPGDDEWKATPEQWHKRIESDRKILQERLIEIMRGGQEERRNDSEQ